MSLISNFISHQVWLQRNASHEVNELAPFIQQMRDEVRAQVLQFGDDSRTRQNLEKMLRDLDNILSGITDDWESKLTEDLQELAGYEADWTVRTLSDNVSAEFVTPSPEQVWSAIKFNPLALDNKPVEVMNLISGWGQVEINRLVMGVKSGFVQGKTTRQIVKEVVGAGGLADVSQRNAATVVRTALNHVSTTAREQVYVKNSDIVEKYEWVSTLDSRTSTICRSRDGQKWEIGKGPLPPAHPNACLEGTLITTDKGLVPIEHVKVGDRVLTHNGRYKKVTTVMCRPHSGLARDLIFNLETRVRLTNEHPILTSRGWRECGSVNVGDVMFQNSDKFTGVENPRASFVEQAVLLNAHNIETSVTNELVSYGIYSGSAGMSSAINLNCSVTNDEI